MSLKEKLRANQLTLGSWITLSHPAIAEIMANAGFDWVTVDLEHSVITLDQAEALIRTLRLSGIPALVRVSANDATQIKRVMDSGASGIIVPMVNTKKEAERAVAAVYYAPEGERGVGLARAQEYGAGFHSYRKWLVEEAVVVVQIEHQRAVANIDEILSVEGIDAFFVGPYDLSASMGIPGDFENEAMIRHMEHLLDVSEQVRIPAGIHVVEPDMMQAQKMIQRGFRFVAYSLDTRMIDYQCRQALEELR